MTNAICQSIIAASNASKVAQAEGEDHAAERRCDTATDVGLRDRLRAEGDLLDLLRGGEGGDYTLKVESIRGRTTLELVDWFGGVRRHRIGSGACFPEAYRSAIGEAGACG